MTKCKLISVGLSALVLSLFCVIKVEARSDDELVVIVGARLSGYVHGYADSLTHLFEECGSDSNRFCNVAISAYEKYSNPEARSVALSILHKYGTNEQIPFLESCAKSSDRDALAAIKALARIETFSEKTILRVRSFNEEAEYKLRMDACEYLAETVFYRLNDERLTGLVLEYLRSLGSDARFCALGIDRLVIELDPNYKYSSQRLEVLRSAMKNVSRDDERNDIRHEVERLEKSLPERDYVLRAIRELLKDGNVNISACKDLACMDVDMVLNGLSECARNEEERKSVLRMGMGNSANGYYRFLMTIADLAERRLLSRDEVLWCLNGDGHPGRRWVLAVRYKSLEARILTTRLSRQLGDKDWSQRILKGKAMRELEEIIRRNDAEAEYLVNWLELNQKETKEGPCGI